jgi:hypothetical protein
MSGLVVNGVSTSAPDGVDVRTFLEDGGLRFPSRGTRASVTELVVHETVTTSVASTVEVLQRRGLSVHLVCGPDGELTQHGDLVRDKLWHAGPVHNGPSFGVEVVNPYSPELLHMGLPWTRSIHAPWAWKGDYVLPTPAQAETIASLVKWATGGPASGLVVPRRWPGMRDGKMRLGPVAECSRPTPGVVAHHYFGHADGAWLALYAWMRLEAGLAPDAAYEEAAHRATGARGFVDVHDLVPAAFVA